jgi:peptidyl-prolyl cis-trans isomerase C
MTRFRVPLLSACALLFSACPQKGTGAAAGGGGNVIKLDSQKPGTTLAKVGSVTITVEEFEEKVAQQGPFARPRFQDPAKRREFLDALVRQELLAQEAIKRGMGEDPEVVDTAKKVLVQKLTRQEYDTRVKQEDIKATETRKYYDEHPDEFHKPAMMRCAAVVLNFGADKAAARKRAEDALKKLASAPKVEPGKPLMSDPFQDLAAAISEDPESKALRGDLKFLSKKEMEEKYGAGVAEACFALKAVNDQTGVVEGAQGWFLLKHTGLRQPLDRTFEQVETQIRNRLFRERRTEAFNAYVEGLRKTTAVTVDDAKLNSLNFATQPTPPPPGAAATGGAQNLPTGAPPDIKPSLGEPQNPGADPHAH